MAEETPANPAALANALNTDDSFSLSLVSLAHHFVKKRGGGGRCVEARDVALHRQTHAHVASLLDQPVNALALAANDEANGLGHVELPCQRLATRVESDTPDVRPLDLGDRRRHPRDVRDAKQLARAGAGFDRGRR